MLLRSVICVALVVFASTLCGTVQQHKPSDPQQQLQQRQQHQHEQRQQQQANEGAAWFHGHSGSSIFKVSAAAAYDALLHSSVGTAISAARRSLLSINQQRPNATAAAGGGGRGVADGSISSASGGEPPNLNPAVLPISSRPQRPTPAPSVAAGEATTAGPWTGPTLKSVGDVQAGDSCVCWTPDWCTCGWQSCPYKPPAPPASVSESTQAVFGPDMLPQLQLSADAPGARLAPPLTQAMLRRFNKRISTQLIFPLYQFTREHYILEGAKEVVAAGGDSYKFNLANLDARGRPISNVKTPLDMIRSPSLPYADVFDLPLSMYFMWVFPDYSKPYEPTYELANYLIRKYQGTGKQFFIGVWEGDHALRKPGTYGANVPVDLGRMETLQFVVQEKQRAVDNAKRDNPACRNVHIWNYIEANFVVSSIWNRNKISIVNWLVPTIDDPPVDYISYSAYEVLFSGDWRLTNLTAAFDYMAQRLPDKPGVPGPRVFMGEWAYPMYDPQGRPAWNMEESREKGLYAAAVAIAWGSQFNQYWQLYSNHRFANGTGDRGFWLILPNRQEAPIWTSMKDYFAASDEFLKRFWACYGGWPSDYTYRVWAVKTLMKLVNNATKPEPAVRELGSTSYSRQARVVADNTFGQMGPTITFRVSGETAAEAATHAGSYIPIMGAVKLGDVSGNPASSSSDSSQQFTPPLVPQFLPSGGGDRGRCSIPLPMIAAGVPRPSPAPAAAPPGGNKPAPPNATRPAGNATSAAGAAAGNATRPNATAAAAGGRPPNATAGGPGGFAGGPAPQAALMVGGRSNSTSSANITDKAVRSAGGTGEQCPSWSKASGKLQLSKEDCPILYPRLDVEDVASGKVKPYTYGGIDRIGCANCQQKGLWPKFCLWRRTEAPLWDAVSCNQRESKGRSNVQRNLELAVNISRYWPQSSGITIPQSVDPDSLPPGPADITPCDVFRLIRGRTLWIIGDSQMKGLFTALKCFMLEFWDLQQYSPTWNTTTIDYFDKLPRNSEAKCIHLPESTRICQIKVLWADTFAEKPGPNETRWAVPVFDMLQQQLADPSDIIALNFGLWYDPKNPVRYYNNIISLGKAYQAAKATFPNIFFVETVKLHWADPPGDQDGPRTASEAAGMEQCKPTDNVVFDARTSELKRVMYTDPGAAVTKAAAQLLSMGIFPEYQLNKVYQKDSTAAASSSDQSSSSNSNSGRHRRRLLGIVPQFGSGSADSGILLSFKARVMSWWHSAHNRFEARLQQQQQQRRRRSLLQLAQQPAGGPLEDSPFFSAAAAPQLQQPASPAQPPKAGSSASAAATAPRGPPPPAAAAAGGGGSAARNAISASSSSSQGPQPVTGTEFPLLKPAFAPNGSSRPTTTTSSSSSNKAPGDTAAARSSPPPPSPPPPGKTNSSSNSPAATGAANWLPARTGAGAPPSSPRPGGPASPAPPATGAGAGAAGPPASKPIMAPGFGSVTLPPELATEAVLTGLWRNQIARAVLRDRFGMAWVPIYNATVPAYWGHRDSPEAPDCIHYCNPGAPQNWLAKLMLAIAVNVKPLEGEITDKRCLWGTKVVYDEGEKGFQ